MYIHVTLYVYLRSFMKSSSFWNTKSECCCVGADLFFSYIFKNFNNVHVLVNITKCMTFVIRFTITKCFWKRCIFRCCCITTFNFHWSKCNMRCVHIWAQSRNCMHPFTRVIFSLVNNAVVTLHQTQSCWGYSPTNVSDLYIHQFRITLTPYIYFFICPLYKQFLTAKWIKVFFLTMRVYLINY